MFIKQESLRVDKKTKASSDSDSYMEDCTQTKHNYNNHYHLGEKNATTINITSGVRSLICDLNGIIIAEMVYRCMICDMLYETIPEVQMHYQSKHIDEDIELNNSRNHSNCLSTINTSLSPNHNTSNTTSVSFFGSFRSSTDKYLKNSRNSSDSSPVNTLTFDVPSGLKTLQQQFQTSTKKKNIKPSTSVTSKPKTGFANKSKSQILNSQIKSGLITCEICGATKFYKYLQRRFGVYSCVGCAKFYSKYLLKPVNYTCENLGNCNLKVSECEPNGRCKACLIHKCKSKFIIDSKKLSKLSNTSELKSKYALSLSQKTNGKKTFQEMKAKKYSKPTAGKDISRTLKGKLSNSLSIDIKSKTSLTPNKVKTPEDDSLLSNKGTNSIITFKKAKTEKPNLKVTQYKNGITSKTITATNGNTKTSADKISIVGRGTRSSLSSLKTNSLKTNSLKTNSLKTNSLKTNSLKTNCLKTNLVKTIKRTRRTSCRKCLGCKAKDCNNCVNCLDRKRNGGRDKLRQKCIKRKCLNSRNS